MVVKRVTLLYGKHTPVWKEYIDFLIALFIHPFQLYLYSKTVITQNLLLIWFSFVSNEIWKRSSVNSLDLLMYWFLHSQKISFKIRVAEASRETEINK